MTKFTEGLNDLKPCLHASYCNDESILGSLFEMYSRYIEAEKVGFTSENLYLSAILITLMSPWLVLLFFA